MLLKTDDTKYINIWTSRIPNNAILPEFRICVERMRADGKFDLASISYLELIVHENEGFTDNEIQEIIEYIKCNQLMLKEMAKDKGNTMLILDYQ